MTSPQLAKRPIGFAPPPHDGFAFIAAYPGMSLAAGRFPVLAVNAPYASIGQEYVSHSTNPIRRLQKSYSRQ